MICRYNRIDLLCLVRFACEIACMYRCLHEFLFPFVYLTWGIVGGGRARVGELALVLLLLWGCDSSIVNVEILLAIAVI